MLGTPLKGFKNRCAVYRNSGFLTPGFAWRARMALLPIECTPLICSYYYHYCHYCHYYHYYLVMDQKTLVKRRWSYKVRRTVYILTLSEFARHEFTNLWLETFSWTLPDTLSLSLTGIRLGPKQARRVNDSTASLSLAERWTITEIRRQSNSVLTYSLLTDVLPL